MLSVEGAVNCPTDSFSAATSLLWLRLAPWETKSDCTQRPDDTGSVSLRVWAFLF